MATDRALMQQALEALERNASQDMSVAQGNALAMHALRARLAEPEPEPGLCRTDGRCQYAIDSGAEGEGHCPKGKCVMPALAGPEPEPETCKLGLQVEGAEAVANGWKLREVLFEDGEPIAHREPPTRRPLTPVQEAAPELLEALRGMLAIVNDSRGVAGYHLNGNTAEWDEFDEVDAARAIERKITEGHDE